MKIKYIIALCLLFVMVAEMAIVVKTKRNSDSLNVAKVNETPVNPRSSNVVIRTSLKSSNTVSVSSVN